MTNPSDKIRELRELRDIGRRNPGYVWPDISQLGPGGKERVAAVWAIWDAAPALLDVAEKAIEAVDEASPDASDLTWQVDSEKWEPLVQALAKLAENGGEE